MINWKDYSQSEKIGTVNISNLSKVASMQKNNDETI